MRGSSIFLALGALAKLASAKAVFAHYMVGTVTQEHAAKDIDDAQAIGIDGFALNIGDATRDYVSDALAYLFARAEAVGFKLYISMDVYASGDACYNGAKSCNGPKDYKWIWDGYKGSSAYYKVDGKALISTFSSGGFHNDTWLDFKDSLANDLYFMPDFDETKGYYEAADGWWEYWGPVVDGIFSWETAWPERGGFGGKFAGDVSIDVTMAKSAAKHKKMYMMGLSPLQYKNAYKAHVYRQGDLNLPKRMINILQMDPQPDFVQFQTWNDGPEAHYIGTLWPEQNTDHDPNMYANQDQWDHTGWQSLLASFIKAYKSGSSTTAMAPADGSDIAGAMWYRTELTDVECPFDGKAAFYSKPDGFDDTVNYLYWSIILNPSLGSGYTAVVSGKEEHTAHLSPGINYGYGAGDIVAGEQIIKVKDPNGNVVYTATGGMCVSDGCPNYIYNGNYQVVPFKKGDAKPTCQAWPSVCVEGTGDGDLAELCAWTCHYNVCHSPCKCTSNEEIFNKPPLANSSLGGSAIFAEDGVDDLCQYACSRSYCPSNVCKQTGIDADHTCSFPADEAASWSETGANLLVDNWISGSGNDDWLRKMDVAYNLGSGQSSLNCDDISTNSCPSPDSTCAKWPNPAFWYVRALSANVNSYFKYAHEALQDASIRNLAMVDQMIIDFKMSIPDHDLLKEILGTIAGVAGLSSLVTKRASQATADIFTLIGGISSTTNAGTTTTPEDLDEYAAAAKVYVADILEDSDKALETTLGSLWGHGDLDNVDKLYKKLVAAGAMDESNLDTTIGRLFDGGGMLLPATKSEITSTIEDGIKDTIAAVLGGLLTALHYVAVYVGGCQPKACAKTKACSMIDDGHCMYLLRRPSGKTNSETVPDKVVAKLKDTYDIELVDMMISIKNCNNRKVSDEDKNAIYIGKDRYAPCYFGIPYVETRSGISYPMAYPGNQDDLPSWVGGKDTWNQAVKDFCSLDENSEYPACSYN